MALHIRNQQQHVRQQPQHVRHRKEDSLASKINSAIDQAYTSITGKYHIRLGPKNNIIGIVLGVIVFIVLVLLALHYFRVITLPLKFVPQKGVVPPASHLQYFFF